MLRFFSKIRYKLASENSLAKYSRYAFGEILLVVLGILFALQVNNWNEERKELADKSKMLLSLQNEIQSNLILVNNHIYQKNKIVQSCQQLFKYTGPNPQFPDTISFDSLLNIVLISGWLFSPQNAILTDILNSNKLNLIKNDSLKIFLGSLTHDISLIQSEEEVFRHELHNYILPFVGERYPTRNMTPERSLFEIDFSLDKSKFNISPESLLKNVEFESIVNTEFIWNKISLAFYNGLRLKYQKILALIEIEN